MNGPGGTVARPPTARFEIAPKCKEEQKAVTFPRRTAGTLGDDQ